MNCVGKTLASVLALICLTSICLTYVELAKAQASTNDWTMFRHDAKHQGYTDSNFKTNDAKLLWTYKTNGAVVSLSLIHI